MIKYFVFYLSIVTSLITYVHGDNFEVIIKSYEALTYRESAGSPSTKYLFSFCLCSHESKNPSRDSSCQCQMNKEGKIAKESDPKAIYSASCLHDPDDGKCLFGRFPSKSRKYLYVKVAFGSNTLTCPEWQSLMPSKRKSVANLAAKIQNKKIRLEYLASEVDVGSQPVTRRITPSIKPSTKTMKKLKTKPHPGRRPIQIIRKAKTIHQARPVQKSVKRITTLSQISNNRRNSQGHSIQSVEDAKRFLQKLGLIQKIKPTSFDINGFKKAMLTMHNKYRYAHGVNLLSYDALAESAAQSWANKLGQRESCLAHEGRRGMGENLFYFAADYFTDPNSMAEAVVKTFYSEGKGYDYNRFRRNNYGVGHFTQMIWRSSTKMGVGISIRRFSGRRRNGCQPRKATYMMYIVVKYTPAGNVQTATDFLSNVRPVMRRL